MGFKRSIIVLEFDNPEFDGFEVKCRRLSVGQALEMDRLRMKAAEPEDRVEISAQRIEHMVKYLADGIISWNLEDENDQPVPTTFEGLMQQDLGLILTLATAWRQTATGVSAPLADDSDSGDQSLAESIPMEAS